MSAPADLAPSPLRRFADPIFDAAETLDSEMTGIDHDLCLCNGLRPSRARCTVSA